MDRAGASVRQLLNSEGVVCVTAEQVEQHRADLGSAAALTTYQPVCCSPLRPLPLNILARQRHCCAGHADIQCGAMLYSCVSMTQPLPHLWLTGCSCYLKAAQGVAELDLTFNVGLRVLNVNELNVCFLSLQRRMHSGVSYNSTCAVIH